MKTFLDTDAIDYRKMKPANDSLVTRVARVARRLAHATHRSKLKRSTTRGMSSSFMIPPRSTQSEWSL